VKELLKLVATSAKVTATSTHYTTAATFVAAVDPGRRISFLFARFRYLSNFRFFLLLTN